MFYNARWYDPALGRFAQADSIVPPGVQGLDRYSYTNNNPVRYTDPSGHICVESDGDSDVGMAGNCHGGSNPNYKGGLQGPRWNNKIEKRGGNNKGLPQWETGYIGGASPADIYQWQDFSSGSSSEQSSPLIESFADLLNIFEMYSPAELPTLRAFLSYMTSESGDVVQIRIDIVNEGASSATLERIKMSEESLPSMNSCGITTADCYFKPRSSVYIGVGELESITICQNCLEDRSTIYSHPFNPNKNNYIEVFMVLSMPIDRGNEGTRWTSMPFIYTIPPR